MADRSIASSTGARRRFQFDYGDEPTTHSTVGYYSDEEYTQHSTIDGYSDEESASHSSVGHYPDEEPTHHSILSQHYNANENSTKHSTVPSTVAKDYTGTLASPSSIDQYSIDNFANCGPVRPASDGNLTSYSTFSQNRDEEPTSHSSVRQHYNEESTRRSTVGQDLTTTSRAPSEHLDTMSFAASQSPFQHAPHNTPHNPPRYHDFTDIIQSNDHEITTATTKMSALGFGQRNYSPDATQLEITRQNYDVTNPSVMLAALGIGNLNMSPDVTKSNTAARPSARLTTLGLGQAQVNGSQVVRFSESTRQNNATNTSGDLSSLLPGTDLEISNDITQSESTRRSYDVTDPSAKVAVLRFDQSLDITPTRLPGSARSLDNTHQTNATTTSARRSGLGYRTDSRVSRDVRSSKHMRQDHNMTDMSAKLSTLGFGTHPKISRVLKELDDTRQNYDITDVSDKLAALGFRADPDHSKSTMRSKIDCQCCEITNSSAKLAALGLTNAKTPHNSPYPAACCAADGRGHAEGHCCDKTGNFMKLSLQQPEFEWTSLDVANERRQQERQCCNIESMR